MSNENPRPGPETRAGPPRWFRILFDTPAVLARILGGVLAMSFLAPDEVVSRLAWLYRLDGDLSMWFLFEFIVRTAGTKPPRSYAFSTKGVLNLLAALPPTGLAPIDAVRHAGRFLMTTTATPFRDAIQEIARATKRVVVENRQSLDKMFTLVVVSTLLGGIIIAVLEEDVEHAWHWALTTVLPFLGLSNEFAPTTISGRILESLLILVRYATLTWLGALVLKTWRLAVDDASKDESD